MKKLTKVLIFVGITLFLGITVFVRSINLNPLYPDSAVFYCFAITLYALAFGIIKIGGIRLENSGSAYSSTPNQPTRVNFKFNGKFPKSILYIIAIPWAIVIIVFILSSVLFNYKAFRDQIGVPEVRQFTSDIQPLDSNQIPIVDKELALNLADKKLGEKASLGSQVRLGEPTIQKVNGKLIWVVPLHHSGFFKWITNMQGSEGYITVSATNMKDVEYVGTHKIKYQPNSYLFDDLERYVRFTKGLFSGITDYSFELDDEGNPYWVVTTYKNQRGFSLPEADGVILVNASTGDTSKHGMDDIPKWVDRVQPEEFIMQQIYNQGEYVNGIFNFANKDKFKPSQGNAIIYNNDRCYLFTGLTSVGSDESALGFMMVDMVTKQVIKYEMSGATEYSAQASAQGKVQHLNYRASFPIVLNVGGQPTYFMTLKDKAGLVKQYAYVSVENYSVVGTGETVTAALTNYEQALRAGGNTSIDPSLKPTTTTGTILRVSSEIENSNTIYRFILKELPNVIFTVSSDVSLELALTQVEDSVSVEYKLAPNGSATVTKFDNLVFTQK